MLRILGLSARWRAFGQQPAVIGSTDDRKSSGPHRVGVLAASRVLIGNREVEHRDQLVEMGRAKAIDLLGVRLRKGLTLQRIASFIPLIKSGGIDQSRSACNSRSSPRPGLSTPVTAGCSGCTRPASVTRVTWGSCRESSAKSCRPSCCCQARPRATSSARSC